MSTLQVTTHAEIETELWYICLDLTVDMYSEDNGQYVQPDGYEVDKLFVSWYKNNSFVDYDEKIVERPKDIDIAMAVLALGGIDINAACDSACEDAADNFDIQDYL